MVKIVWAYILMDPACITRIEASKACLTILILASSFISRSVFITDSVTLFLLFLIFIDELFSILFCHSDTLERQKVSENKHTHLRQFILKKDYLFLLTITSGQISWCVFFLPEI